MPKDATQYKASTNWFTWNVIMHSLAPQNKSFHFNVCAAVSSSHVWKKTTPGSVAILFCITNIEDVEFGLQILSKQQRVKQLNSTTHHQHKSISFFHLKHVEKGDKRMIKSTFFQAIYSLTNPGQTKCLTKHSSFCLFFFFNSSTKWVHVVFRWCVCSNVILENA